MARRASPVTQAEIAKLIRAARAGGVDNDELMGVRLDRHGVTLLFGKQASLDLVPPPTDTSTDDASWGDVDAAQTPAVR